MSASNIPTTKPLGKIYATTVGSSLNTEMGKNIMPTPTSKEIPITKLSLFVIFVFCTSFSPCPIIMEKITTSAPHPTAIGIVANNIVTGVMIPNTIIIPPAKRKGDLAATPVMARNPVEDTIGIKDTIEKSPDKKVVNPCIIKD